MDSVEDAKTEIIVQIRSLEADSSTLETPISVSLDLQLLKQSDNPEQRSLADVLSVISELRTAVGGVEKRLENPESLVPARYLRHVFDDMHPKSLRSRHMMMEMRHSVDELSEIILSKKPTTAQSQAEVEERLVRLRHELDHFIHTENW